MHRSDRERGDTQSSRAPIPYVARNLRVQIKHLARPADSSARLKSEENVLEQTSRPSRFESEAWSATEFECGIRGLRLHTARPQARISLSVGPTAAARFQPAWTASASSSVIASSLAGKVPDEDAEEERCPTGSGADGASGVGLVSALISFTRLLGTLNLPALVISGSNRLALMESKIFRSSIMAGPRQSREYSRTDKSLGLACPPRRRRNPWFKPNFAAQLKQVALPLWEVYRHSSIGTPAETRNSRTSFVMAEVLRLALAQRPAPLTVRNRAPSLAAPNPSSRRREPLLGPGSRKAVRVGHEGET